MPGWYEAPAARQTLNNHFNVIKADDEGFVLISVVDQSQRVPVRERQPQGGVGEDDHVGNGLAQEPVQLVGTT